MSEQQHSYPSLGNLISFMDVQAHTEAELQTQRDLAKQHYDAAEATLRSSVASRQTAVTEFVKNIATADPLYRAAFEIVLDGKELDTDVSNKLRVERTVQRLADLHLIGRSLVGLNKYLLEQDQEVVILTLKEWPFAVGDKNYPKKVIGLSAGLIKVPVQTSLAITTKNTFSLGAGERIRARAVELPTTSELSISSNQLGFDDHSWLDEPSVSTSDRPIRLLDRYDQEFGKLAVADSVLSLGNGVTEMHVGRELANARIKQLKDRASHQTHDMPAVTMLAKAFKNLE